tara:strand:- start:45 stop:662 length:618 start_codon:yes stop_codon:yes gene_type:complete
MGPKYWKQAIKELQQTDSILKTIIDDKSQLDIKIKTDPFITLARAIVGQQISVKAAETIWRRLVELESKLNPSTIVKLSEKKLKKVGLSTRKIDYLKDLGIKFTANKFDVKTWSKLDDTEITQQLVTVKGIGEWTAEMFLIFYMGRPDVFPLADIGLQRAMSIHYKNKQPITKQEMITIAKKWIPWRTVATWYLWRSIDPIPVEY